MPTNQPPQRYCYYLTRTMRNAQGGYRPTLAFEGHAALLQTDFDYGTNFRDAADCVHYMNRKLGLEPAEAMRIVATSLEAARGCGLH